MRHLLVVAGLLLAGCTVLPSDHSYSGRNLQVNRALDLESHIVDFQGCSGVVIGAHGIKSYVATAGHCTQRFRSYTSISYGGRQYAITRVWADHDRDISFLEIDGYLPPVARLLKDKPDNSVDTTIGFVDGQITRLSGRAIPGQSGGGVFTEDGSLWGTVSTTGTGVSIYPALERLGLLWIIK